MATDEHTVTTDGPPPTRMTREQKKAIFAGSLGNAIEYLDWGIYASLAPVFAGQFFPEGDPVAAFLSTLAIFAAAFSAGGEWPSSVSYLVESAAPGRRAFAGSFQQVSTAGGIMLAALLTLTATSVLDDQQMRTYGWRVAFAFAATLGLIVLWLRARAEETPHFDHAEPSGRSHSPMRTVCAEHKLSLLRVVGITVPGTILYYLWITNMPGYVSATTGLDLGEALLANCIAVVVFMLLLPLGGVVSDRLGRRPTFMFFLVGFALYAWPAYRLLDGGGFWTLLLVELIGAVLLVGNSANVAAMYAELFPTSVRTTGTGLPYASAVAVFGGTAPYFTTWLTSIGHRDKIWIYVVAATVVGMVTIMTMPDGAKKGQLD